MANRVPEDNSMELLQLDPSLTDTQRDALLSVCRKHPALFGIETPGRMKTRHHIRLDTDEPIRGGVFPLSPAERNIVTEEVDHMIKNGIIDKSKSSYRCAPRLIAKKTVRYDSASIIGLSTSI